MSKPLSQITRRTREAGAASLHSRGCDAFDAAESPVLLDLLGLTNRFLERDLEEATLRELETFLLELGSGFSFVARQKRIQLDGDHFYIDLLLYNRTDTVEGSVIEEGQFSNLNTRAR